MKKIFTFFTALIFSAAFGQFTTPGTGITYNLASLSAAAPTVLQDMGTYYQMHSDITISAADQLIIDTDATVKVDADKALYVYGTYKTTANKVVIEATDAAFPFKGIRFEDGSTAEMKNTKISYGGGVRVLTANFLMDNCIINNNIGGLSTSGALSFSKGSPVVKNSQFLENLKPALGSAANAVVSATIDNNYFYKNNKENKNAPQINMGPGGADTIRITNNTLIGDRNLTMVGGISASALVAVTNRFRIEGNIIRDHRYGFNSNGATSTGIIKNNIIENNNIETNPLNGGSGISLYNAKNVVIRGNQIRNNLWGITLITSATADLGTEASPGNNIFYNNANSGAVYALYNNTPNAQSAVGNCWREGELSTDAMVEQVITHQVDNSTLGLVTFSPYLCSATLSTVEAEKVSLKIYPVPNNGDFTLEAQDSGNVLITDAAGKIVYSGLIVKGKNTLNLKINPGVYLLVYQNKAERLSRKIIIK